MSAAAAARRDRLTRVERDALMSSLIGYEGIWMDELTDADASGAARRREHAAIVRAMDKVNRACRDGRL